MAQKSVGPPVGLRGWLAAKALGLKSWEGYSVTAKITDHDAVARLAGSTSAAGVAVNDLTSMQVSTVWGCVRVRSESVGSVPWAVYERDSHGNARKVDHDLSAVLIGSPNSDMTSQEMREAMAANLCLRGNAYCLVDKAVTGRVTSIYPHPSSMVQPERNRDTGAVQYKFQDRGRWETYPAEKVWHVKGFSDNGLVGYSPVSYARQAIGLSIATAQFGSTFFSQGATMPGFIQVPEWLPDGQRDRAKEIMHELWQGLQNANKMQLLEGGMTYVPASMPLEDAQFLQTRQFQRAEICAFYRVPPHMVADLERATFSNIEQMSLDFIIYALLPDLVRFEQTASRRLFSAADRGRFFLRFNYEGFLRGDSAARAALYSVLLQNGVMNRNEARALENLPYSTDKGMDDFTTQSNMTVIQLLESMARTAAPKP